MVFITIDLKISKYAKNSPMIYFLSNSIYVNSWERDEICKLNY